MLNRQFTAQWHTNAIYRPFVQTTERSTNVREPRCYFGHCHRTLVFCPSSEVPETNAQGTDELGLQKQLMTYIYKIFSRSSLALAPSTVRLTKLLNGLETYGSRAVTSAIVIVP